MIPTTWAAPPGLGRGVVEPPDRPLRVGVAAGTATAFGAGGHVLVGGTVTLPVLVAALVAAAVPAWILAGRERGWAWIAGLQVGTQQLVHAALSATGPPVDNAGLVPHDVMFHGHVLAGLLTAAALRLGERRLWDAARRVAERVARWCRRLVIVLPPPIQAAPVDAVAPVAGRPGRALRHVLVLRGPPLHG